MILTFVKNMDHIKRYQILYKLRDHYTNNDETNLIYQSDFELLIAVLLSAQSKDVQVNKVTKQLFKIANTPQSIIKLGLNKIKNYIKFIGLFNSKAENILKTCQLLITKYNGVVPNNRLELESLPGVGRKTSNIILNIIFNHPTIAVDTHVFRVCNRSQFAIGNNALAVEHKLMSVVPHEFKKNCHKYFINHGRYTCFAKKPNCSNCIISSLCEFQNKTIIKKI